MYTCINIYYGLTMPNFLPLDCLYLEEDKYDIHICITLVENFAAMILSYAIIINESTFTLFFTLLF